MLNALDVEPAIAVVRAFSYFSHLANIAEDQHHNRCFRRDQLAGKPPREGSLLVALERIKAGKVKSDGLRKVLGQASISPVLTAHPTEVQRKSILDREVAIARLLTERDRVRLTADETAASERALRREVSTMWETRMLRRVKPTVYDEIENALAYYRYTFLAESRGSTPPPKTCSIRSSRPRSRGSCRPSCASAAGSGATATVTRS